MTFGNPVPAGGAQTPRYPLVQRLLHWTVALLVLFATLLGGAIGLFGFEELRDRFGADVTNFTYTAHKSLGVLVLVLMVLRILARIVFGRPARPPLPRGQRIAAELVHGLLYLLLLLLPVLGWLATAAGGFPVQLFSWELPGLIGRDAGLSEQLFQWHQRAAYALLALVALHIAAALYHGRIRRDGVMQSMSLLPPRPR